MLALLINLIFLSSEASAAWEFVSDSTVMGVGRSYLHGQEKIKTPEGFAEILPGMKYSSDHFKFEAKPLIRYVKFPKAQNPNSFSRLDLTPPDRYLKMSKTFGKANDDNQTLVDAGSLWMSYNGDNLQASVGRRALGIGVLKVIPVWNRLSPVLPTLSGYMQVNNPDIIDVRLSKDQWTLATYSIMDRKKEERITAVEFINYEWGLESHYLLGNWWNQPAAGYAGVYDSNSGIFKLESLIIAKGEKETKSGFQIGLGWEKAFNDKLSFLTEYYHSSFGSDGPDNYLDLDFSKFRTLLAKDYLYPQVSYKFTDFLTSELGFLVNANDKSFMLISETTYSFSDNIDLFATIRSPVGQEKQEFGYINIPIVNQAIQYVRWFSLGFKMTL